MTTATRPTTKLADASLGESLRFVATGLVPSVARGLFAPRPKAMSLLTRLNTDRRAIAFLDGIRSKYGGDGVPLMRGEKTRLWGGGAPRGGVRNSPTQEGPGARPE